MNSTIRLFCTALSLSLLASLCFAQAPTQPPLTSEAIREAMRTQLPAPPAGFTWHLYKNAVFPKPTGWNEKEQASSSAGIPVTVYAASPEQFSETKQFEMGLTIQIFSGSQKIRGLDAKKLALAYLKPFLDAHKKENVLMLEQSTSGNFERTFFRFKDAPPNLTPIIVHKFILANNVTDSVHIFTFESPVSSWDENWGKYGTPILGKVNVLPNFPAN